MRTSKTIFSVSILGLLLVGSVCLKAQNAVPYGPEPDKIKWHTFQEAVELNKKEKRKIFIDMYTDWCGWCKVLDRTTFTDPIIVKYMNEKYYAVKLNAEMKDTIVFNNYSFVNPSPNTPRSMHQLATSLFGQQSISYPTTVYLDESFNMLTLLSGYRKPEDLEPIVKFFGDNVHQTVKWDDYIKTFKGEVVPAPPPPTFTPPVIPH